MSQLTPICLKSSKHQVTQYIISHACPVVKMPPWLNILSTGAEVAGTQYIELTK